MMDHATIRPRLMAFHDGEVSDEVRRDIDAHLAACAACRTTVAQWRQTAQVLFPHPPLQASEAFVSQVMGRIKALPAPGPAAQWMPWLEWLVPAVGIAGLLFFIGGTPQPLSVEAVLFTTDGRAQEATQLVLASEPPTSDEVFGVLMEGSP